MNTAESWTLLLRNLLSRLDADAKLEQPQFRSFVSDAEREALRSLLNLVTTGRELPPDAVSNPGGPAPEPVARPPAERDAVDYQIDKTVLSVNGAQEPEWILCLDFGTAKSKAFACKTDSESALDELELDDLELMDLPLGEADRSTGADSPAGYGVDDSVYAVVSSVWICDDGLMYAGSGALDRGSVYEYAGTPRKRLDSIKQQISQISATYSPDSPLLAPEKKLLDRAMNPTTVELTYERQRQWGAELMARSLVNAQIVADTFRGRWREGIHVSEVKAVLKLAAEHSDRLHWMLDRSNRENEVALATWGGGLESLAAASGRVWTVKSARELMLVVDIGAGTTDLSLFLVVQHEQKRRAFPVWPGGTAIRQAGDSLDSRLLEQLLDRAHLGEDPDLRERMREGLRLKGVRQMKERLFQTGLLRETLPNDETVELTQEQFLASEAVQSFENKICGEIENLLRDVDESWYAAAKQGGLTFVLTGGGCNLPMIRDLKDRRWMIGGDTIKCRLATDVPDFVSERFGVEFANEYPQLAVAMGGAMPLRLDERHALLKWAGGTPDQGSLEEFQTKGI